MYTQIMNFFSKQFSQTPST